MAVWAVARAWSALLNSIGLQNFQTAYWPYVVYDGRTDLPHNLTSRSDGFLHRSHVESFDGVDRPVKTEKKVDKATWERSGTAYHAMGLLILHFFRHLHALLASTSLYTIEKDSLLKSSAVRQLQSIAPATLLLLASFLQKVV